MSDAIGLNHGTPHELLAAGGQLALKGDIWDDLSVQNIVQKILDLFGLDIPNWQEIIASFDGLRDAFEGTYVGNDPDLNVIQNIVKTLRNGLTGLIDWSRIPQLSLSQLTSDPGPNLLTGFGDFADADTMDSGGNWTWDASVGGGSARCDLNGSRKVLTSELVAVSEGQSLTVSGLARKQSAVGSGNVAQLVVVPFVGDTAQAEVVIGGIGSGTNTTGTTVTGSWTVPVNVNGVRVRITSEAAGTSGQAWWDDVTLRKTATSLPQQWVNGLTTALDNLGDDISDALAWIKDLIEKLTGQARSTLTDALNDTATFATQLQTLLSGGTVGSPLPNLTGLIQLGQSQITGLPSVLSDLSGGISSLESQIADAMSDAIEGAVGAVIDGMNNVGTYASAIIAAITASINDIIESIFGDGGTKWGQELYVAAGPVTTGFNDVPLGFGMPFSGKITDFQLYSSDHVLNGTGTKIVVEARKNGTAIRTMTWNGGNNSFSVGGLSLSVTKGDRITFYVTEASSAAANMSVTVMGTYV